ncbi:hypothetical protein D3C75_1228020 [compost metagenome]
MRLRLCAVEIARGAIQRVAPALQFHLMVVVTALEDLDVLVVDMPERVAQRIDQRGVM